jgi:RNA polymerase-binding transcription factor DksA
MSARVNTKGTTTRTEAARNRNAELKHILEERRREILSEVQHKMRDVRAEGAKGEGMGVLDAAEASEADIQDDIEFALIQMKSETLHKIGGTAPPAEAGTAECGDEISERVCASVCRPQQDCEEEREVVSAGMSVVQRRSSGFLIDMN